MAPLVFRCLALFFTLKEQKFLLVKSYPVVTWDMCQQSSVQHDVRSSCKSLVVIIVTYVSPFDNSPIHRMIISLTDGALFFFAAWHQYWNHQWFYHPLWIVDIRLSWPDFLYKVKMFGTFMNYRLLVSILSVGWNFVWGEPPSHWVVMC